MSRLISIAVVLIAPLVVPDLSDAGASTAGRCRELKAAATAQRVSDLLAAYSRNRARPDPAHLRAEIAEAESVFDAGFKEAEAQGDCGGRDSAQTLRRKSDAFVRTITIEALGSGTSPAKAPAEAKPRQNPPEEPPGDE